MRRAREASRIILEDGWNKGIAGVTRTDDVLGRRGAGEGSRGLDGKGDSLSHLPPELRKVGCPGRVRAVSPRRRRDGGR